MAKGIITDLLLNIATNTAELKKGLGEAQGQINGFSKGIQQIGSLIKTAFAGVAILESVKAVFEFGQEIGKATDQVKSLTGFIGQDLVDATAKAKSISDTFNIPFEKLLESARAVSNEFGISIPDALDKIKQGYALTGSEEFLDILKEYPAQFASAGANADDFFRIATQQINTGVYSDKGVDAVKEFALRVRELTPATRDALQLIGISGQELQKQIASGSLTTFQALQQVSTRLKSFSDDSREVGAVLADVFGGAGEDAGIRFIKTLGDADVTFESLVANANDTVSAQLRLSDATEELNKFFVDVFGSSSTFTTGLKADLTEIAVKALKQIKTSIIQIVNFFIDLYNESILFRGVVNSIILYFKQLFEVIKLVANNLINTFTTAGEVIKAILTGDFSEIPNIIKNSFAETVNDYKTFGTNFANNFIDAANSTLRSKKIELITEDEVQKQATKAVNVLKKGLATVDYGKVNLILPKEEKPFKALNSSDVQKEGKAVSLEKSNIAKNPFDNSGLFDQIIPKIKTATSAWDSFGNAVQKNVGNIAVSAIDSLGSALGSLASGQEITFGGFVKSVLLGITQIIKALLAQAIAAQIASNSQFGLFGLVLAGIGIAAVEALFAKIPAFANGVNNFGGGLALVGEKGAELVNLPRGSSVFSNSKSKDLINSFDSSNMKIQVVGVIRGQDIYLANNEAGRRRGNTI